MSRPLSPASAVLTRIEGPKYIDRNQLIIIWLALSDICAPHQVGRHSFEKGLSIQSLAKREVSVDTKNHSVRTYLHLRLLRTHLSILRPPRSHIHRLIITRKNLANSKPPSLTFSLPSFYKTQKANANHQSCKALLVSFLCSPSLQLRRSRTGVESMKKAPHNGTSTSAHHIPAPILICLTTTLSSITIPLLLSTSSSASIICSKLDFAPFSCVKRAIARLARRPRCRRVWNSAAREREGM